MSAGHIEDVYPLSPLQQGLLFHGLYEPAAGLYITQNTCRLEDLDKRAFERAWHLVTARYATLRTAFVWKSADRPLQMVARRLSLPIEHQDWRSCGEQEVERKLRAWLREDRQRGFQLSRAPLMRLALFRVGVGSYFFVWTYHHLILDGWCRGLVLSEVLETYDSYRQGGEPELPPTRPYRDYIAWLGDQDLEAAERFWRRELAGLGGATQLGEDGVAAVDGISPYAEAVQTLGIESTASIRSFCSRQRLTPATIAQAAWALVLARHSGREDVLCGIVVSGRSPELAGVASMVGLFANTIPLRVSLAPGMTVLAWLEAMQQRTVELRRYEHTPLSEIRKWCDVAPRHPLLGTLFAFENYPDDTLLKTTVSSLEVRDLRAEERADFPLVFSVAPGESWQLAVEFDLRRIGRLAAERILRHYAQLLASMVARPYDELTALSALTPAERFQVLVEWNDTATELDDGRLLHGLFEARAAAAPDAVAVLADTSHLSYRELARRASILARHLRSEGVKPECVVGVLVERSPDMPLAILGVLKAGAAFLPLDPSYPSRRLAHMLDDSGASALLSYQHLVADLDRSRYEVLYLDELFGGPEAGRVDPRFGPSPDNAACVIYTSGSTGLPKGVVLPHRPLVHYTLDMADRFGLGSLDRMLQFAAPSFDVVVEELFPTWWRGGAVVIEDAEVLASPRDLARALARQRVTAVELPAVYWHQWMEQVANENTPPPTPLRLLLLGSDKPSLHWLDAWRHHSVPTLYVFGLTETAITSSLQRLPLDRPLHHELPIGRPVADHRLYAVDRRGLATPAGVPGELLVAGAGLARGYLNRPAVTAERFVPDPFASEPGARLYRTGDLARWRSDGRLDFLGRLDHQVKIRGFRVELGEVEIALGKHAQVRDTVVVAREDQPGERRLVAYLVTADPATAPTTRDLRAFLATHLPEFMIPAAFVHLSTLPLSPNGKLDRRALPAPGHEGRTSAAFVAPRSDLERQLAKIWQAVLRVPRVGVHDNFFELGGDSILSIQIVSRAHRARLRFSPRDLFENPSVARLAGVTSFGSQRQSRPIAAPGLIPLTPIQHWFFALEAPLPGHWNMPVLLNLRRPVAPPLLRRALVALAGHHDALRLSFERRRGTWSQRLSSRTSAGIPLVHIDLSGLPTRRQKGAVESVATRVQANMGLTPAPLLRAVLFDLSHGAARLLLAAHHLIVDGVSWRVLVEDLELACRQLQRRQDPALPDVASPFAVWAKLLAGQVDSSDIEEERGYWQTQRVASPLPVDHKNGPNTEGTSRELRLELSVAETEDLLAAAPRAYRARVDELLLTALARATAKWTGSSTLSIDLEGHGRSQPFVETDLSRTVGWLTTIYPVVLALPPGQGPGAAIQAVKEQVRSVPSGGIGYGLLRYGKGSQDVSRLPHAQILFNYMGRVDAAMSASSYFGLVDESIGSAVSTSAPRSHLLEIRARVWRQRLETIWTYSGSFHRTATIESLAKRFLTELRILVDHCLAPGAGGYTPSDFPLAGLDQEGLDHLWATDLGVEDVYPLSPMQQGMLFHSLYDPGDGAYVAQLTFELGGKLEPERLRAAWDGVLRERSVLRTAFVWKELDEPRQLVCQHVELLWRTYQWDQLARSQQEEHLAAFLAEDRHQGFDTSTPPLLRVALFSISEDRWWLVVSLHQMLLDGWSLPLLLEDVAALYREPSAALVPRLPYRRFITWLREQDRSRARAFWRRQLAGYETPRRLEASADGDAANTGSWAASSRTLPTTERERLEAAARGQGLTLNTVFQGAWALLLSRYLGRGDVLFGTVMAGRPADLEGAMAMQGLFINTVPSRVWVKEGQPVASWLKELQHRQVEAGTFQWCALGAIQRWAGVPPGEPLFESILSFENYPVDRTVRKAGSALGVSAVRMREQTHYPLSVAIEPGSGTVITIRYPLRSFSRLLIRRMLAHLAHLLSGLGVAGDRPLAEVSMFSPAERHQLVDEWNDTRTDLAPQFCLQEGFAARADRHPDGVAIVAGSEHLTYAELHGRARRLASYLQQCGVGAEDRVAICFRRRPVAIVALLGVLHAGGAYVPLDPENPQRRSHRMLEEAKPKLLLSQEELRPLVAGLPFRSVFLDSDWPAVMAAPPFVRSAQRCEQLAYVIFTSGSTGRPKGVAVSHASVVHLWAALKERLFAGLGRPLRVSLNAPLAFDGSVKQLVQLLAGHTLLMISEEERLDPRQLLAWSRRSVPDVLDITPAQLQALLAFSPGDVHRDLPRNMLVAGEAMSDELWHRLAADAARRCFNLYGPTEATVDALVCRMRPQYNEPRLGRPLANFQAHVLDPALRSLASGWAGELFLAGRGLARGYLGRPDQTAVSFIPNPLGDRSGARLYRTGDRVRRLPDGELEFLGRLDGQVKIRGHRIETGEVEMALREHPAVRQAVVMAKPDVQGRSRLVAYWVGSSGPRPAVAELRTFMAARVADPMIPTIFVALDALPQTPSGKVDRAALPEPELERLVDTAGAAPRDAVEQQLAAIWSEVLGVERVRINDNFFALGGDSILSILIVGRAARLGMRLSLKEIFQYPTIGELATRVREAPTPRTGASAISGVVPLTPIQRRFFEGEPVAPHRYQHTVVLEVRRPLAPTVLAAAFDALLNHHDALRLRFRHQPDGWEQHNAAFEAARVFQVVDLSALERRDPVRYLDAIISALQGGLDLAAGPLVRSALLRRSDPTDLLVVVVHHLAVDAVSWGILLEDLMAVCGRFGAGLPPALPPKTTSFKHWAEALSRQTQTGIFDNELALWLEPDDAAYRPLPVDFEGGTNRVANADSVQLLLRAEETEILLREAPTAYRAKVLDLLLAALARALASWTGQASQLVDLEGHGREEILDDLDLSRTVGWFTTIHPVFLEVGDSRADGLRQIKERLRRVPNNGLGYGSLRYFGRDRGKLAARRAAEVVFNYLGQANLTTDKSWFAWIPDAPGRGASGLAQRRYLLQVEAQILAGQLRTEWTYSRRIHRRETVEHLAAVFVEELRKLLTDRTHIGEEACVPTDFPLAKLDRKRLERVLKKYSRTGV